jgi:PhzF family phenazine biosynthesis protein
VSSRLIFTVDAFAEKPFAGNPAAVCPIEGAADEAWMQNVAAEMNLSETAFCWPEDDGFRLRWFTPTVEVDLCGHATLATAHVLWQTNRLAADELARFYTKSGLLTATQNGNEIQLDFPVKRLQAVTPPEGLLEALGTTAQYVGKNVFDYLVELKSETAVRSLKPDFSRLKTFPVRGVIVTARSDEPQFDFVSRFFAPAAGVNEDPVTGSAHCALGPYWADKLNKNPLVGFQASARGGVVRVCITGERVLMSGHAVTVMRGELLV